MKKILFLLAVSIILSSCGLFRRVEKDKSKTLTENNTEIKSEAVSEKTDNSTTKIVETIDTTVKTSEVNKEIENKVNLEDLFSGIVLIDSGLFKISQVYDQHTKTLKTTVKVRPQEVTVKKKTETTIKKDTKETEKKKEEKKTSDKALVETKKVSKIPVNLTLYILLAIGIIVGGYFGIKFLKNKYPGKIPFL